MWLHSDSDSDSDFIVHVKNTEIWPPLAEDNNE